MRRFVVAMCVLAAVAAPAASEPARLTFLHFNDLYEMMPTADGGGIAELKTVVAAERARAPGALVTLGGDLLSPSLASGLTQGAHMVDLMAALGVDVAVLGNHEFDFGGDVLRRRIAESPFPWLAANVFDADGTPFGEAVAVVVREVSGLRVGFLGVLTEHTPTSSAGGRDARFIPAVEAAKAAAAELTGKVDVVVALTHLGFDDDRRLAREARGAIHLILGGHDHDPLATYEGGTLIVKAGYDGHFLAVVDLEVDGATVRPAAWRFVATRGAAPDPAVAARIKGWEDKVGAELDRPLATVGGGLDSRNARVAETTFGAVMADALKAALGADAALLNGGGLRAGRVYADGHRLTLGDLRREMPFNNAGVLLEVTGTQLLAALENGVSRLPQPSGRFPQVSGVTFRYDLGQPAGRRVVDAAVGGKPLDPGATYRLATIDFLAGGGDDYVMLAGAKRLLDEEGAVLMVTLVADWLARRGAVTTPEPRARPAP